MTGTYERGVEAEKAAAEYLRQQKYEILETRYKTSFGEVDLIARQGEMIVAVEVKSRATYQDAVEAVTPRNQRRVQNAFLHYIAQNPDYQICDLRFDVVALVPDHSQKSGYMLHHLDNAWYAQA